MRRTRLRSVSPKRREELSEWDRVKTLVRIRSGGRCEVVLGSIRCVRDARDAHHVVKRSQGGTDSVHNVIDICREHHDMTDWPHYRRKLVIEAVPGKPGQFACRRSSFPSKWAWRDEVAVVEAEPRPT